MKKILLAGLFILMMTGGIFGQTPAGNLRGYNETQASTVIAGMRIPFWLYNTYYNHNGDGGPLYRAFFDHVHKLGYLVDYFNHTITYNTPPENITTMMRINNADVAMTVINLPDNNGMLQIICHDVEDNIWWMEFYPLKK